MMKRRSLIKAGLGLTAATALRGCDDAAASRSAAARNTSTGRFAGFEMPAEAAPHQRTFMQWPVSLDVYDRASLANVQRSVARIANTISRYEPVVMLAGSTHTATARQQLGPDVELWPIETDDLWCRDSGPTFIRNARGELAVALIQFNGWGRKQPHRHDARIAAQVARRLGLPLIDSRVVGEQGGLEHDGAGTMLAHASSWVNPNRNRISQDEITARLLEATGNRKMIWAPGVRGKDITDYHIDALARFVAPGKVLIQLSPEPDPDDPWSVSGHETLRILREARDAEGKKLEIILLPDPIDIRSSQPDFVASYVNYYVCNGAVIAAQFGDKQADGHAREILQSLYPDRSIELLDIDPIGESGGGIHCATQQQPAGNIA